MSDRLLIILCIPLCVGGGALGSWLASPAPAPAAAGGVEAREPDAAMELVAALRGEIGALHQRQEDFDARLADLADARRAMPAHGDGVQLASDAATEIPGVAAPAQPTGVSDDEIASLFDGALTSDERWMLLDRLRKSGQLAAVLAQLEEHADRNPSDPEAQYNVGLGYIMKLQEVGASFEAGPLATKADAAFDRALALDEDHLGARKSKAISLSFWPAIMGKRPKAIEQFEILIEKQKQHPAEDSFAESYMLLGNLHLESGNQAKALEVFQAGLAAHPNDSNLQSQITGLSGSGG